jgi:hypothetical protein
MCVRLLDVALVWGTVVLVTAGVCCCADGCFRALTVIFDNHSDQFGGGGRLCRVHAIFRMRLLFTYAAFWTCASSLSLTHPSCFLPCLGFLF